MTQVTVAAQPNPSAVLHSQIVTAMTNNRIFLALPTPTNAQAVAQIQALTRQMQAVIRLVTGVLDSTT